MPDSRSTILGPPAAWDEEQARVPAFNCLPVHRRGAGAAFLASAALHALVALSIPAIIRSLPPDPDAAFQTRLRPSLQAALILRMPERVYLPVRGMPAADAHSAAPSPERTGLNRTGEAPSGKGPSVARVQSQAPFQTILIQPGKPVADDPRTNKLPSLLYLSKSETPVPQGPQEPAVPGVSAIQLPVPKTETVIASGHPVPEPPPAPSSSVAENTPKALAPPPLPLPSPWSLVSTGAAGEVVESPARESQAARGAEVAVLSIASSVPQARELVEIPPVNQPAAAGGVRSSAPLPEMRGAGKLAAQAANSTVPPRPDRHSVLPSGTGNSRGPLAAKDKPLLSKAQSEGKPLESQGHTAAPGRARTIRTSTGTIEILDLPNGTEQLNFPSAGSFDVVIVDSSPGATIPDAERLLTGRPVQTVFLTLGTGKDWILQYCLPGGVSAANQAGMVVTLGRPPKVEPPFIQQALIPANEVVRATQSSLFQGMLGVNGRFVRLHPVLRADYQPQQELLPYLEQWQFRPVKVAGVPAEVEVLLLVPPFVRP